MQGFREERDKAETSEVKDALDSKILRCLKLIKQVVGITEVQGVGSLKSHSCLTVGEVVNVSVTNNVTGSLKRCPQKIDLRFNSNTTVYEMKQKICKEFKITMKEMKLMRVRYDKEIGDCDNGRSIRDMRFQGSKKETFIVLLPFTHNFPGQKTRFSDHGAPPARH